MTKENKPIDEIIEQQSLEEKYTWLGIINHFGSATICEKCNKMSAYYIGERYNEEEGECSTYVCIKHNPKILIKEWIKEIKKVKNGISKLMEENTQARPIIDKKLWEKLPPTKIKD